MFLPASDIDRATRRRGGAKHASTVALLVVPLSVGGLVQAQPAPIGAPVTASAPVPPVVQAPAATGASMLTGKLRFTLPDGFNRTVLPPDGKRGSEVVFLDPGQNQMVLTTESPAGDRASVGDDDPAFLDAALADHLVELDKPAPTYKPLATRSLSLKGLGLRRTDGRSTFFDHPVYSTSLVAGSGVMVAIVMVVSNIEDRDRHQALVARIVDSIASNR